MENRDFYGQGTYPAPTGYGPGTPEKVAILEERARCRQRLWHPLDAAQEAKEGRASPRPGDSGPTDGFANAGDDGELEMSTSTG